jgi:endonuclease-3
MPTKNHSRTSKENSPAETYAKLQKFLNKQFPDVTTALVYKSPLQLLVATIMSAQCTDTLVNKVTPALFKKYPDARAFAKVNLAQLQKSLYPVTFYNNKAKSIKHAAEILVAKYKGAVPKTLEELIELPGVARKTANVVLGHAYGITSGFVVDTHVIRLAQRYGFSKSKDPVHIEQNMMALVPKKSWIKTADQLIWFGRKICTARFDKCHLYPIVKDLCPEARKFNRNKTVPKNLSASNKKK